MSEWIDRTAALAALSVKAQTLYAYVSRGWIETQPDPSDPRRSLYRAEDVATLTARRARGRKPAAIAASTIAWGEPSIDTAISTVHHGRLFYRGRDAVALSQSATLEQVAGVLWDTDRAVSFSSPATAGDVFSALAGLIPSSLPTVGRANDAVLQDAESVIGHIAAALGAKVGTDMVHGRLARAWSLNAANADWMRRALVLLADHELNASTFATRVAASTGASVSASLLAGLSTLSGPYHGGAGAALIALIEEAASMGAAEAIKVRLDLGQSLPGFGHPLYPNGDPRATALLEHLTVDNLMTEIRHAVFAATGHVPNVDFALAAFTRTARLPGNVPLALFTLGRSVGWAAHVLEQARTKTLIRPRGRYVGPALDIGKEDAES